MSSTISNRKNSQHWSAFVLIFLLGTGGCGSDNDGQAASSTAGQVSSSPSQSSEASSSSLNTSSSSSSTELSSASASLSVSSSSSSSSSLASPSSTASSSSTSAADARLQSRTGESVYTAHCVNCHGSGAAGSPMLGDDAAWASRLMARGLDGLYRSALNGRAGMPAQGNCADCTALALGAAVNYMLSLTLDMTGATNLTTVDAQGKLLAPIDPIKASYPSRAELRGIEGTVWLRHDIDTQGKASNIIALDTSQNEFVRAAIRGLELQEFPVLQDNASAVERSDCLTRVEFVLQAP